MCVCVCVFVGVNGLLSDRGHLSIPLGFRGLDIPVDRVVRVGSFCERAAPLVRRLGSSNVAQKSFDHFALKASGRVNPVHKQALQRQTSGHTKVPSELLTAELMLATCTRLGYYCYMLVVWVIYIDLVLLVRPPPSWVTVAPAWRPHAAPACRYTCH